MKDTFNYEVKLADGKKFKFYFTNRAIEILLKSYDIEYKVFKYVDGNKIDITDKKNVK